MHLSYNVFFILLGELSFCEQRWLRKLVNVPKPNLSLFASSNQTYDNDKTEVQISADSYKETELYVQSVLFIDHSFHCSFGRNFKCDHCGNSLTEQPITRSSACKILTDEHETYGKRTENVKLSNGISQVFPTENSTVDFIPLRPMREYFWPLVSRETDEIRNEEELKKRDELDNPERMKDIREQLAKYFIEKYKCYTKEQLDVYLPFCTTNEKKCRGI